MLQRVAMHQTRLRVPGLGVDARGVVLGTKGVVLLASVERLVAFLSLYTADNSLAPALGSLRIDVVRSKMGTREIILSLAVQTSEQLDRIADVARLALGYTFTGTSRHFVQFRDPSAPFGYDVAEVIAADGDYVLYHHAFSQVYQSERQLDLRALLLRLRPQVDPSTARDLADCWMVAEEGLGPAWIHYFIRSAVPARVGLAEWPPASALEDTPIRRYLFYLPSLPKRMVPLARHTAGVGLFRPVAPGVCVEVGYRHPVTLRSCPVFPADGITLLRGSDPAPFVLPKLPSLGPVESFAQVTVAPATNQPSAIGADPGSIARISVPLRLAPSLSAWQRVTASFVQTAELPVLRRIVYALGTATLRSTTIAICQQGSVVMNPNGVECLPIGTFLRQLRPGLFIAAGYDPVPAVEPDVLFRALGEPANSVVIVLPHAVFSVPKQAFASLQDGILDGLGASPLDALSIAPTLDVKLPEVQFQPLGIRPLAGVDQPPDPDTP